MKEAHPFAQFLGLPQIKAQAVDAAKRLAESRALSAARNIVSPKAATVSAATRELSARPPVAATPKKLTEEEIESIGAAERRRGAEIMAAAMVSGSTELGLALLRSGLSAKRAISAIDAAQRDRSSNAPNQYQLNHQSRIEKLKNMGAIQ